MKRVWGINCAKCKRVIPQLSLSVNLKSNYTRSDSLLRNSSRIAEPLGRETVKCTQLRRPLRLEWNEAHPFQTILLSRDNNDFLGVRAKETTRGTTRIRSGVAPTKSITRLLINESEGNRTWASVKFQIFTNFSRARKIRDKIIDSLFIIFQSSSTVFEVQIKIPSFLNI